VNAFDKNYTLLLVTDSNCSPCSINITVCSFEG